MGQLGFQEILIIFLIALLVFGPKKLPELGKSLGKGLREFRKATDELKSSWQDQIKDVEAPLRDVTRDIRQAGNDMKSDFYESHKPSPDESATHETPLHELPPHETPLHDSLVHESPAHETPSHEAPSHGTATHDALSHESPSHETHELAHSPHELPRPSEPAIPREHV